MALFNTLFGAMCKCSDRRKCNLSKNKRKKEKIKVKGNTYITVHRFSRTFFKKKSKKTKSVKKGAKFKKVQSNKSISRNFFDQIPFFAISKMAKNQFLNWEKV